MPVVAVALPGTPLLVPGVAGGAEVLAATGRLVGEALAALVADVPDDGPLVVLAHGSRGRSGPMRPSFAGAGIADRWVPALARLPEVSGTGSRTAVAEVPASVALCCLAEALRRAGRDARWPDVVVHELAPRLPGHRAARAADRREPDVVDAVRAAAGVVVASGGAPGGRDVGPQAWAPAVRGVVDMVAAQGGWRAEARESVGDRDVGGHLDDRYRVTVYRAPDRQGGSPADERPDAGQQAPRP